MMSLRSYLRRGLDRIQPDRVRPRTAFSVAGWVAVVAAVVWSLRRVR